MKLSNEEIQQFKDLPKEHGDIIKLMRSCELRSYPHLCNILAGKAGTKISVIGKIKKFMHERNEVITKINTEHE
jgi:hypothetical protein